jgi:hypothetical protein
MTFRILSFCLLSALFVSCSDELPIIEENIAGNWKVTAFEANTPGLSPDIIDAAKQEALSISYILKTDHRAYMSSIYYTEGQSGAWNLNEETRTIQLDSQFEGEDVSENFLVTSVTPTKMEWQQVLVGIGELSFVLEKHIAKQ